MQSEDWSSKIKRLDLFSQEIEILFQNNKRKLQTHCGVVFSMLLVLILLTYGSYKAKMMMQFENVMIQQPDYINYYSMEHEFDKKLGWNVAFGLTDYGEDSVGEPLDESIG